MKSEIAHYNYFKALLVIGMICGHAVMLLSDSKTGLFYWFKTYINLITFSGFVFVFAQLHDLHDATIKRKVSKEMYTILKLLIAFYVSGLFYRLLISHTSLNRDLILKILFLKDIPGYSEFLLAFALFSLMFALIKRYFVKVWLNQWTFIIIFMISLVSSFLIKKGSTFTLFGLFVGSHHFGAFPVLQYSVYYSLGILIHRKILSINIFTLILSLLFSSSFIIFTLIKNHIPGRFPPSIYWILGALFPVFMTYLAGNFISKKSEIQSSIFCSHLQQIGRNTLFHLLLSNILLFSLSNFLKTSELSAFFIGIFIIIINQYFISMIRN